jgi:uncharacterized protein
MKIILSPSKSQSQLNNCLSFNQPKFLSESLKIFDYIKSLDQSDMAQIMKLKGKKLEETYEWYQTFNAYSSPRQSAIHLYTGVVYEGLQLSSYTKQHMKFLQDHVRVLSAMYGVLRPTDCIYPYRLDFTMKFKALNLKEFWKAKLIEAFKQEDVIIDLASNEFTQLLSELKEKIHKIEFVDQIHGQEKIISHHAKRMRGLMLNQIILNQDAWYRPKMIEGYTLDTSSSDHHYTKYVKHHD